MNKKNKGLPLKGFRDFLPEEALKRNWLEKRVRGVFELWGFDPVETPTLEPLKIFEGEVGEDEQLFYKFTDPGGRKVALRYDQTVPICRVVGRFGQQLTMPFKRYQIQPAFRAEKPQAGRYREFLQCDADIFGLKPPMADAETIALSLDIYRQLGFKQAKVLINDRSMFKNIPYQAISSIDKLKKIGEDGVLKEMEKKGILLKKAKEYLSFVKNLKPNQTIKAILAYLKNYGFPKNWYTFEPSIARSFSYSSGPIWEIEIPGFKGGSVLGGERYDSIVKNISGLDIPGTGFGLGFDRTLEAAEEFKLVPNFKTKTKVLVTIFDKKYFKNCLQTAKKLRENNINTEIYSDPLKKLDKQIKYADKKDIPYIVIIGPDEVKQDKLALKNLKTGKQELLKLAQIIKMLK